VPVALLRLFRPILLLCSFALLASHSASAQQVRKHKHHASSVQNHHKRPARSRSRTTESPLGTALHYTSPRSSTALAGDLGIFLNRIRSGSWGVMVMSLSRGDTLFSRDPGAEMRPASTMKLFTSALAFDHFGTEYQFSTDVLRNGPVSSDGTLHGDIIIRGDGDPALAPRFIDGGPNAPMETLAQQVAAAGIKHITGSVIGDATGFDDQKVPDGWLTRYLGAAYAARVSALSLDENLVWVAVGPGSGGSAAVSLEPATTTLSVINHARTVGGSGIDIRTSKHTDGTIEVRGSIGRNAGVHRYSYVVDDPALFAAGAFKAALATKGVRVDGQVRLAPTPSGAEKVTSLASPTLARMVSAMNRESINHYAELLFRDAARGPHRNVQGSAATGNHAMHLFFANTIGADTSTLYNADGSGLSTDDHVTARAMVQLLSYAHTAPWGPAFHASMPLAGESGTQRRRMTGGPAQGNLHAKTGTTNDVIALAGYVTALDGEVIAFAFLYNGTDRWTAKSTIDIMGETLANFAR
jgi:D-alanyl-D-alanine carboxypeptidase/D-alanyl-D-alanine-endopeptidase (penicillin-binding protein 4)